MLNIGVFMIFYETKHTNEVSYYSLETHTNLDFSLHYHKNFEIVYCYSGSIDVRIDNISHSLLAGTACIILPNQTHSFNTITSSKCFVGVFSTHAVPGLYAYFKDTYTTTPTFIIDNFEDTIDDISNSVGNQFKLSANLCQIISHFSENNDFIIRDEKYCSFAINTINYLESNFNKNPSLVELSNMLGYNSHYVSNLFGKYFNKNFAQTINEYRIEYALKLLENNDFSITDIAIQCGYDSTRNFNRNFLSITGLTPSQARKGNVPAYIERN